MIKIEISKGTWLPTFPVETLLWELCPNPKCPAKKIYYPRFMKNPRCSSCNTSLIGGKLVNGMENRISYHLGVV